LASSSCCRRASKRKGEISTTALFVSPWKTLGSSRTRSIEVPWAAVARTPRRPARTVPSHETCISAVPSAPGTSPGKVTWSERAVAAPAPPPCRAPGTIQIPVGAWAVIAAVFGLMVQVFAAAGFLVGRSIRRAVGRSRST
jgi:hypothetical protein